MAPRPGAFSIAGAHAGGVEWRGSCTEASSRVWILTLDSTYAAQQGRQGSSQSLGANGAITKTKKAVNAGPRSTSVVSATCDVEQREEHQLGLYDLSTGAWSTFEVNCAGPVKHIA